jgi:hypothetical protein
MLLLSGRKSVPPWAALGVLVRWVASYRADFLSSFCFVSDSTTPVSGEDIDTNTQSIVRLKELSLLVNIRSFKSYLGEKLLLSHSSP